MKRRREKGENVKEKDERGKKMRKGLVKGQNKCNRGKNYGKKAMMGVKIRRVVRGGKISFSQGGINIVFGPKFRPLQICVSVPFCFSILFIFLGRLLSSGFWRIPIIPPGSGVFIHRY
jgi:hypothetical protein